jgi:succinylglutamate desuccinylase
MQTITRGDGNAELVIVGSLHGDEPAGKRAIERILEKDLEYAKPVKFIIANEQALEKDIRYIDTDLNRSFPGDPDSDSHEERLAAKILEEIGDAAVLDLHTTHSYPDPFATAKDTSDATMDMARAAGVEHVVVFEEASGSLAGQREGIVVETGYQHSDEAVDNAVEVIERVLAYHGIIERPIPPSEPEVYRYLDTVKGTGWEFTAKNFELVREGEVYARKGDEELTADRDFYPVLMSTHGYDGQLGFRAEKITDQS